MNSIPDTASPGLLQDRSNLQTAQYSGHSRKQSVNAYESLDAGLTIQTREGDIVTLSSNSFSEFNAFEYNSQGQIQTDSGYALISQHTREITLTTGEQFSFSVQGDLNEQELSDIAAIIQGVDGIVAEVAEGDMDEAVEKAMAMGSYSSVSMYSAEISYERSYAVTEETRSVASSPSLAPGKEKGVSHRPKHMNSFVDKMARFLEKQEDKLLAKAHKPDRFAHKMARFLEKQEDKLLAKAQKPLTKLFDQLLKNKADADEQKTSAYAALKTAGEQLDQIINDRLKKAFETTLDGFV